MNIYTPLEHSLHVSSLLQAVFLAMVMLIVAGLVVRRRVAAADGGLIPDEGVSLRNAIELLVETLVDLCKSTIGDGYRGYFPVIGTIFLFVLVSNLMGLIPGVGGATSNVNTTTAWAIISFVVYNAAGIRKHGAKYIYHFMGPSIWEPEIAGRKWHVRLLMPVFLPLEIVLHFARILTLSIRLLANMFADHAVVTVWLSMVPIVIPAIFMGLGLLIAFLQAFVFSLLTAIYIGLAVQEAH